MSLALRAGEVVGIAGLVGAGRSEIARALFGLDPGATGQVWIDGVEGLPRSPVDAMHAGIALVPEDRKRQGLVLSMSALANTTLPTLMALARLTFIRHRAERGARPDLLRSAARAGCRRSMPSRPDSRGARSRSWSLRSGSRRSAAS